MWLHRIRVALDETSEHHCEAGGKKRPTPVSPRHFKVDPKELPSFVNNNVVEAVIRINNTGVDDMASHRNDLLVERDLPGPVLTRHQVLKVRTGHHARAQVVHKNNFLARPGLRAHIPVAERLWNSESVPVQVSQGSVFTKANAGAQETPVLHGSSERPEFADDRMLTVELNA